ncbi:uncharacterized protein EV420DRAFT_1623477 [Desarmillaria tabescens]|uniref:DUF6570 domain-containing protein n=1 Tax=Armillaria tabescens TaxID=1929756 RepID=A0AA39J637_ARMTA|nr:uncharacterized protein EV420DRAFT_1623477 [Desarmillaria tabescens]KAK0436840.1 hypothetical protein EV420DRAFT_1623477 [Desarmillaria tabescens]
MIALCRAKCMILQLKEESLKGNVIVYPQRPSEITRMLPPSIEEITSLICILFVGSHVPTQDWLKNHAKPLTVNGGHVRRALIWLKANNPHYHDIQLNEPILDYLDLNPTLPFTVQHIPFIVITNVYNNVSSNRLKAAALSHVKSNGGGYIEVCHDPLPVNEFNNPALFPLMYPTFPDYSYAITTDTFPQYYY